MIKLNLSDFNWSAWRFFVLGLILGAAFAAKFIYGWFSVFLHEMRHALLSNAVGNKWKDLVVQSKSGHFEYAYTKKTARFNAFVALAPYWLPVFTIVGGGVSLAAAYNLQNLLIVLIAFFYGIDLVLNFRDISPIQTDITQIKGGYGVGLFYIIFVNLFIFSLIAAWVSSGWVGLKFMVLELWNAFYSSIT